MILRPPAPPKVIAPPPVPVPPRQLLPIRDRLRWLFLTAAVGVFLFSVWRLHIPGKGFTALINFGDHHAARFLAEVDPETTHIMPRSDGYDAQWYAQLALKPDLRDPQLAGAIDNLPYRARRILFSWTAYGLGLGQPRWVLEAFALQNVLAWLLLGWVLLRWLPPTDWGNVGRWTAVMFSFGLAFSIRAALVDGPGLLLLATGMALAEAGRPWLSALCLGIAGLGKETCLLSGAILAAPPQRRSLRAWAVLGLRGLLLVAPLALWMTFILVQFGPRGADSGARGFAPPLVEFWHKTTHSMSELLAGREPMTFTLAGVFTVVSLATQFAFFALRPRWCDPWWRLGAAFALLMTVLGESVWEGYPSAATRVLLPMLLAFNLTVPRGRRWCPVLILGNLTVLSTPNFLIPPDGAEPAVLAAPVALARNAATGEALRSELAGPWLPAEKSLYDTWRWTTGSVEIVVHNPHPSPLPARLSFGLNSRDARHVAVAIGERELWRGTVNPTRQDVQLEDLVLPPGETRIALRTDRPAELAPGRADTRPLAFRVLDLRLHLAPPAP